MACADATATTVPVGIIDDKVQRLLRVTEEALEHAITLAQGGRRLGDLCAAIEEQVVINGYSVVREFVGHGVGRELHEEPQVPNYGRRGTGPKLKPGMTAAVEFVYAERKAVLRMPSSALRFRPENASDDKASSERGPNALRSVWLLKEGTPKQAKVDLGVSDGALVEVLSGLHQGDSIVVDLIRENDGSPTRRKLF